METRTHTPRILIVTPEVSHLPDGMGAIADRISVGSGKLADMAATLIAALFEQGADVHVALPDYRAMFCQEGGTGSRNGPPSLENKNFQERIHLAKDRAFYYLKSPFVNNSHEDKRIALAFQREVMNTIVPRVWPDFIHCVGWRTGLIPALARKINIPCLFTVTETDSFKTTLSEIEDRGIDGAAYWQYFYYDDFPSSYEETREANPVDFLASGILAAHFVSVLCPVLPEGRDARGEGALPDLFQKILTHKRSADDVWGFPKAEDSSSGALFVENSAFPDQNDFPAGAGNDTVITKKYIHYYEEIIHHPIQNATVH
jgi:starch synthase/alpha-amylase